jgi:NADPH2:quinone reductase
MRSLQIASFGSLDDLAVVDTPDPNPRPGQVVVEVRAAGVNFVDALIVQGRYQFTPPLPYTPGTEVAGVVSAVGDGVTALRPGDRVLALPPAGGYASHVAVPVAAVHPIPASLDFGAAACLPQSYVTMHYAYRRLAHVAAGEWVVVLGAGGGIGLAATDLATALGARVVACASSPDKLALARAAGAEATIAYDGIDLKAAIREATGGATDVVVDPVGGDKAEPALRSLGWGGRYLVIGFAGGGIPRLPANQILLNGRSVLGVELGGLVRRDPAAFPALLGEVLTLVGQGRLHPVEPQAFPLTEAANVLRAIESRAITGKAVLVP